MDQTPVHDQHNPDLLTLIPKEAGNVIEVGCSSGALAREYKKTNSSCHYLGIEIVSEYAKLAERYCDRVVVLDIESVNDEFLSSNSNCDCWIFGDALEHLRDPWLLLSRIRKIIPKQGSIVACIPNAQHWSVQARLGSGLFRYEPSGLLDKTHLRWFTRITMIEMFHNSGFRIVEGFPRIFDEPNRENILPAIRHMAQCIGADPETAVNDALPLQYVIRAIPV